MDGLVWKALNSSWRRRILELLQARSHTITELSAALGRSRFTVRQHLGVLEQAGLVIVTRRGRTRVVEIDTRPLHETVLPWLAQMTQFFVPDWLRARGFKLGAD